jgi:hypothetical protein
MSRENVEIVKRLLLDGVDAAPILRDDEALADYLAQIEPLPAVGDESSHSGA